MQQLHRITIDPEVMAGKPCIRGMRVTVAMIVETLAAGRTVEQVLADFPIPRRTRRARSASRRRSPCTGTRGPSRELMRNWKQDVRMKPDETHLTTEEAREFLGVPGPDMIRLLEAGAIPYRAMDSHRRFALHDLVEYTKQKAARRAALDKMARDAYEAGLYDKAGIPRGGRDE